MTIGVAVIGAGMAGRGHAAAYRAARSLYNTDLPEIRLVSIGDVNPTFGKIAADKYGYERTDSDWRAIADDPNIDAVSVVVANHLHREIVEGLLDAGKHVLCEKPLADTLESAQAMVAAANKSDKVARVGLTFLRNPGIAAIRQIVSSGQLGKVLHFSGQYWCDYSIDPTSPMSWRYKGGLGTGALADIGSHITYLSEFITGKTIKAISGARFVTSISERPVATGAVFGHEKAAVSEKLEPVENDDYAGFMANFGDASGSIEVSRVAAGHPNTLTFEVFCEKGSAQFDMRHNGEFQLQIEEGPHSQRGIRTVILGPDHPYFAGGFPVDAPGVGVSQNDQFFFQNRAFLAEVAGLPETAALPYCPSFEDGFHNMEIINTAVESFHAKGASIEVPEFNPSYLRKL
jgi:predicted dehydrogenase